jgi:hypothetical protein
MKAALLPALLCFALVSYGQDSRPISWKTPRKTKDPQVWEVTQNGNDMGVAYVDATECAARFAKDAALNRWDAAQQEQERAKIPAYGYLRASWARSSVSLASADHFVFLLEDGNNKEILRYKPEPSVASPFGFMGAIVYTDLAVIPIEKPIPDGARLFVIEAAAQKRYEYVLHP